VSAVIKKISCSIYYSTNGARYPGIDVRIVALEPDDCHLCVLVLLILVQLLSRLFARLTMSTMIKKVFCSRYYKRRVAPHIKVRIVVLSLVNMI
jgi:hypothetical protein